MLQDDTIAAISTAPGVGAIAIVRLSGPDSFKIAEKLFWPRKNRQSDHEKFDRGQDKSATNDSKASGNNDFWQPVSHHASIGYIKDPSRDNKLVDEVVLIAYQAPHTYTGEDLVEINCHGSPIVTREILSLILAQGARLAEKGEFTKRSFLAGRLDLTQAEAVLDIIHSKTERQSELALSVLQGHLGEEIKAIRKRLIELLTRIVAGIDFPEEVGELDVSDINAVSEECLTKLNQLARTARSGRFLREGLKLAIVGRPNAGKSSLLNRLLNFERAIVTDIPGTTRDSIEEPVDVNGIPVILVDTAGVRHTEDRVEQIGLERTTRAIEEADLTCVLLDGTTASGQEEQVLLGKLKELARPYFVAINKIDLCGSKTMDNGNLPDLINFSIGKPLAISAKMGEGIEDLKGMIEHFALTDNSVKELGGSLNERQGALCIKAVEALERLLAASLSGLPQDCLASDLKLAVDALDAISGQVVTEEVITEVFANFCIGK